VQVAYEQVTFGESVFAANYTTASLGSYNSGSDRLENRFTSPA
jgi:hypothetical protein